jgi:hypothetical protein
MTEAQADNEQSGRYERPERRTVDPTVKFALEFIKASEDRQAARNAEAEARADARSRDLIAALQGVTERMGTHADAQKMVIALVAVVVLMVLIIASMRGADVAIVGKAAGGLIGGAIGAGS